MHYAYRGTQDASDPNPHDPTVLEFGTKNDKHDVESDDYGYASDDHASDNVADRITYVRDTYDRFLAEVI
jgi:hypothetical protein